MAEVLIPQDTNTIAATATSQARALPAGGESAAFYNDGPGLVFVITGVSTLTATLPALSAATGAAGNATPVPVGASIPIGIRPGHTHWGAICLASGTANVYCTPGKGE